jgi:hypothetical protein
VSCTPAKGLEGALDLTEIGLRHETATDSLLGGWAQQIGGDWLTCTVGECPGWRGDRYGAEPNALFGGNVRVMEDHTLRTELGIATSRPELARRAVAGHPESWLAWQMVADSTRPGDPAKLTALTRALELAPDQPQSTDPPGDTEGGAGNWEEAFSFSAKALRARAVPTDVWMIHLAALTHTGHCPEAAL